MSVYVDPMAKCMRNRNWNYDQSCHMIADSVDELKEFSSTLGLNKDWYQPKSFPHFDLVSNKRNLAIKKGAVALELRPFIKKMQDIRAKQQKEINDD